MSVLQSRNKPSATREILLVLDQTLRIVTWSAATLLLLREQRGELQGRSLVDVVGPAHPLSHLARLAQSGTCSGRMELERVVYAYRARLCAEGFVVLTLTDEPGERHLVALEQMALLQHELHHRARNDLQVALGLVRSWSPTPPGLRDLETRFTAMSVVHDLLRGGPTLRLSLASYLGRLVEQVATLVLGGPHTSLLTSSLDPELEVDSEVAMRVGMVVAQLVGALLQAGRSSHLQTQSTAAGFDVVITSPGGLPAGWESGSEAFELARGLCQQLGGALTASAAKIEPGSPWAAHMAIPG